MERWEIIERAVLMAVGAALLVLCAWLAFAGSGAERFVWIALLTPCTGWVFWQALGKNDKRPVDMLLKSGVAMAPELSRPQTDRSAGERVAVERAQADLASVVQQVSQLERQGKLDEQAVRQIEAQLTEISERFSPQIPQQFTTSEPPPGMGRQEPRWKKYVAFVILLAVGGGLLEITIGEYFVFYFSKAYASAFPALCAVTVPTVGVLLFRMEKRQGDLAAKIPTPFLRWFIVFPMVVLTLSGLVLVSPYGWAAAGGWMAGEPAAARRAKVHSVHVEKPRPGKCDQRAVLVFSEGPARVCLENRLVGDVPKVGDTVSVRGRSSVLGLLVEDVRIERTPSPTPS